MYYPLCTLCVCVCRLKGDNNPTRLKINRLVGSGSGSAAATKHLFAARYGKKITNDNKNGKRWYIIIYRRICQTQRREESRARSWLFLFCARQSLRARIIIILVAGARVQPPRRRKYYIIVTFSLSLFFHNLVYIRVARKAHYSPSSPQQSQNRFHRPSSSLIYSDDCFSPLPHVFVCVVYIYIYIYYTIPTTRNSLTPFR